MSRLVQNLAAAAIVNAACNVIGDDEQAVRWMLADLEIGRAACGHDSRLLDGIDEARKILTEHAELKLNKGGEARPGVMLASFRPCVLCGWDILGIVGKPDSACADEEACARRQRLNKDKQ